MEEKMPGFAPGIFLCLPGRDRYGVNDIKVVIYGDTVFPARGLQ
jgi:hypothetical protein